MSGEVSGASIETVLDEVMSVFRAQIRDSLAQKGISEVSANDWYPADTFAAVLDVVERDAGASTVNKLGAAMTESMEWHGSPGSPEEAFAMLSDGLYTCHRGQVGDYETAVEADGQVTVDADTPYPCEFDKGVLKRTAKEFGAEFPNVEEVGDGCRDEGANTCVYRISWRQ